MDVKKQNALIERLAETMRQGACNADYPALPSESQMRAESLMQEAIGIIEELTGETWEFSFITW